MVVLEFIGFENVNINCVDHGYYDHNKEKQIWEYSDIIIDKDGENNTFKDKPTKIVIVDNTMISNCCEPSKYFKITNKSGKSIFIVKDKDCHYKIYSSSISIGEIYGMSNMICGSTTIEEIETYYSGIAEFIVGIDNPAYKSMIKEMFKRYTRYTLYNKLEVRELVFNSETSRDFDI